VIIPSECLPGAINGGSFREGPVDCCLVKDLNQRVVNSTRARQLLMLPSVLR
jgi:hypothetical protein